jgi:hypothetical protein
MSFIGVSLLSASPLAQPRSVNQARTMACLFSWLRNVTLKFDLVTKSKRSHRGSTAPSAQARPPCRLMMLWTLASPIPVPSNSCSHLHLRAAVSFASARILFVPRITYAVPFARRSAAIFSPRSCSHSSAWENR